MSPQGLGPAMANSELNRVKEPVLSAQPAALVEKPEQSPAK